MRLQLHNKLLNIAILLLWGGLFLFCLPVAQAAPANNNERQYAAIIGADKFAELVEQKVRERLKDTGELRRAEIILARSAVPVKPPLGEVVAMEVILPQTLRYGDVFPVNIVLNVDNKPYRRVTLYFRIDVYDRVLVATQDIMREGKLMPSNVRIEERVVDKVAEAYVHELSEAAELVTVRAIGRGKVVERSMLGMPLVMKMGSPIKIITRYKGVQVQADGIAMERGRIGQRIKVRNSNSTKILIGRVIDADTVEIGS